MPKAWATACLTDPSHEGPFSRRGFCKHCTKEQQRKSGRRGGIKRRKSWFRPPSKQALSNRVANQRRREEKRKRQRRRREGRRAKREEQQAAAKCRKVPSLRCGRWVLDVARVQRFLKHFDTFGNRLGEVRYQSDCIDVQVVRLWALRVSMSHGLDIALLGLIVMAHFNSIRTFAVVQESLLVHGGVDWQAFLVALRRCGELWGDLTHLKPNHAIYSPNCMSGSGLPPVGETYLERFPAHFQTLRASLSFKNTVAVLRAGVDGPAAAAELRSQMEKLRKVVPGMLGRYHYKMLFDFIIATGWLPPQFVSRYPVCPTSGTAQELRLLYNAPKLKSAARLSEMLDHLTLHIRSCSMSWHYTDHAGTVGAQLCWVKRLNTPSSSTTHTSRYAETTASWERELGDLAGIGLAHFWC